MKIRELKIVDYRAFQGEHSFRLSERFTVVAGVNGRGKTAVRTSVWNLCQERLRAYIVKVEPSVRLRRSTHLRVT